MQPLPIPAPRRPTPDDRACRALQPGRTIEALTRLLAATGHSVAAADDADLARYPTCHWTVWKTSWGRAESGKYSLLSHYESAVDLEDLWAKSMFSYLVGRRFRHEMSTFLATATREVLHAFADWLDDPRLAPPPGTPGVLILTPPLPIYRLDGPRDAKRLTDVQWALSIRERRAVDNGAPYLGNVWTHVRPMLDAEFARRLTCLPAATRTVPAKRL